MRILLFMALAVIAFLAAILVPLAMSGNLNSESLERLLGREPEPSTIVEEKDPLGPLAQKLQERERALDTFEQSLNERAARLDQREREIDETLEQIEEIQDRIGQQMDEMDAERQERIGKLADMIGAMDPREAAEDLEALSPEDAAEVLILVKDRTAGSILDEMEHRKRVLVHQILQDRRY